MEKDMFIEKLDEICSYIREREVALYRMLANLKDKNENTNESNEAISYLEKVVEDLRVKLEGLRKTKAIYRDRNVERKYVEK